jgi:hypothetical protein
MAPSGNFINCKRKQTGAHREKVASNGQPCYIHFAPGLPARTPHAGSRCAPA